MLTLFIYLLAIVCWLGGMVFFTAFTTKPIFDLLPRADAGKVVSAIFPRYYLLGYVAGTVAVLLALYFCFAREQRLWWVGATLTLGLALASTLYAGGALLPRIAAIRAVATEPNPDPARKAEFDRLHRLSVILNSSAMLLDLLALLSTAAALSPRG